jgi:hypothetical protein
MGDTNDGGDFAAWAGRLTATLDVLEAGLECRQLANIPPGGTDAQRLRFSLRVLQRLGIAPQRAFDPEVLAEVKNKYNAWGRGRRKARLLLRPRAWLQLVDNIRNCNGKCGVERSRRNRPRRTETEEAAKAVRSRRQYAVTAYPFTGRG